MTGSGSSKIILKPMSGNQSPRGETRDFDGNGHPQELQDLSHRIAASQHELTAYLGGSLIKAIEIGKDLLAAQKMLPGRYLRWIDEEVTPATGISRRTAQRYTKLATNEQAILQRLGYDTADSTPAALQKMRSIRMEDGLRLLSTGTDVACQAKSAVRASATSVPDRVRQVAQRVFINSIDTTQASEVPTLILPDQRPNLASGHSTSAIVCSSDTRTNRKTVIQLLELHSSQSLDGALLWISSHGMSQWITLLNDYPRVCIRDEPEPAVSLRSQWWLFGLVTPPLFEPLANELSRFGDVLIPYPAAANPNLNTRLERE